MCICGLTCVHLCRKLRFGDISAVPPELWQTSLVPSASAAGTQLLFLPATHIVCICTRTSQDPDDVDRRIEAGVIDVMKKAKADGKVRHIGFTGHRRTAAHLRVLESHDPLC